MKIIDAFDKATKWDPVGKTGNWNEDADRTIRGVALHKTGFERDTAAGVISWFHNRRSQVSAHYVVDRDGTIYRVIPEQYVSYATGGSEACIAVWKTPWGETLEGYDINRDTVSIEVVGESGKSYTDAQKRVVPELVADICRRNKVIVAAIFSHAEVQADKHDGGEYLSEIKGYVAMGTNEGTIATTSGQLNGFDLGGGFKARFEALGELALPTLGYPVANEETTIVDGTPRVIQRFERGILGWYPKGTPDGVAPGNPFHVRCLTLKEVDQI